MFSPVEGILKKVDMILVVLVVLPNQRLVQSEGQVLRRLSCMSRREDEKSRNDSAAYRT